jgi:hypothetical protein
MSGDPDNLEQIAESDEATLGELSKSENAEAYAAERHEQEAPPEERDETDDLVKDLREKHDLPPKEDHKKLSRYQRLKAQRDELQSKLARYEGDEDTQPGGRPINTDTGALANSLQLADDKHGNEKFSAAWNAFVTHVESTGDQAAYNKVMTADDVGEAIVEWHAQGGASQAPQAQDDPYQAALEQGRQDTNFQAALAEREAQIRVETAAQFRAQEFAKHVPDFHEALAGVDGLDTVPAPMLDMIHRSEFGPAIAYMLAKDCWEGQGVLLQLAELDGNPIAQAQLVGRLEQIAQNRMNRSASPQRTATRAPAPLAPVKGGASPPKDLQALAKDDDVSSYVRARRGGV